MGEQTTSRENDLIFMLGELYIMYRNEKASRELSAKEVADLRERNENLQGEIRGLQQGRNE